ncbi:hypothetical protein SporoP37_15270 [Sporosarcina sp. P37]|uniref:DUF309 domain-containing protein n=2 Tax=unclassified Sporosarcina TaxID=2647733 RepID=UPI000A17E0B5|nr:MULTISPECIES: DUF309 domain-containing protein [unclassified Sporosarcina]ARK25891.1 hypothetical protein SporoP37_15270 [Sporosarcina sp. P37]PID18288.1 DUF309 domain-containing protein [Sporosarcina sp. P35]
MHPYYHPLFLQFIVYFNDNQDYFECHEVLEEYWKEQEDFSKDHPLTGYILMATGLYHWRRGNIAGASRTLNKALVRFREMPVQFSDYLEEVALDEVIDQLEYCLTRIESGAGFRSFQLPVSRGLQMEADNFKPQLSLLPKDSASVIHKHMQRDRSDILLQREEKKKGSR